jgi:hypothetical protein
MADLTRLESAVLAEIVAGPGWLPNQPGPAWSPRAILEAVFGSLTVSGLITSGWLADWPELQSVTLTPWAAAQLGVKIEERPGDEVEIWVPASEPEGPYRLPRHQGALPSLELLPDPPSPLAPRIDHDEPPRLVGGLGKVWQESARRRRPGRYMAG